MQNSVKRNSLNTKAQVTLFMIAGVAILLFLGLFIYFYSTVSVPDVSSSTSETEDLDNYIISYISSKTTVAIKQMSFQGGTLLDNPGSIYDEKKYPYLCNYHLSVGCVNKMISKKSMEQELNTYLKQQLDLLEFTAYEQQGYDVDTGKISISSTIGPESVEVIIDYPITLLKGEEKQEFNEFVYTTRFKLGKLHDLAMLILNEEIVNGTFVEDEWLRGTDEIRIIKHKPYPDTTYQLIINNDDPKFNLSFLFAVEGYDFSRNIESSLRTPLLQGVCFDETHQQCFFNVDERRCTLFGGEWSANLDAFSCSMLSTFSPYPLGSGNNCQEVGLKDGESTCWYPGIAGAGFDPVGSRHYKVSCFDGEILTTECDDFREELCTQYESGPLKKAACRVNRWQDCSEQESQATCEDSSLRDCLWVDYLVKATPHRTVSYNYENRKCVPEVPPGLRFWEGESEEICNLASEQNDCSDIHCPQTWIESNALYCTFMGDCGNYFNEEKEVTTKGYSNSDPYVRDYVINTPKDIVGTWLLTFPFILKQALTGDEFYFPEGEAHYLHLKTKEWEQRMKSSDHFSWSLFPPKVEVDIDTLHTGSCNLWQAPETGHCEACNQGPPCSEYRCKSLGQNCVFNSFAGEGTCTDGAATPQPLEIDISSFTLLKKESNPSNALDDFDSSEFAPYVEKTIEPSTDFFNGWTGFDLGSFQPYQSIILSVTSDIPMVCRVSDNLYADFSSLPPSQLTYSTLTPVLLTVPSLIQLYENNILSSQYSNPLELLGDTTLSFEEQRDVLRTIQNDPTLLAQFDSFGLGDINDLLTKLQNDEEQYKNGLGDSASNYLSQLGEQFISQQLGLSYHFIECTDIQSTQRERFFVKFAVLPDTTPPSPVSITPEEFTQINPSDQLTFGFNEPVDCYYGFDGHLPITALDYKMTCNKVDLEGVYYCHEEMIRDEGTMYITCLDQPQQPQRLSFSVQQNAFNNLSGGFSVVVDGSVIDFGGLNLTGNLLEVYEPTALSYGDQTVYITSDALSIKTYFPVKKKCSLGEPGQDYYDSSHQLTCSNFESGSLCSTIVPVSVSKKEFELTCINDLGTTRNVYEGSITYQ